MKIALVAQHAMPLSGDDAGQVSETRVRELSRSLAGKGHRVTVYAQRHSAALHERWLSERPDVVHALRWTSGLAALAAARDMRLPVVQSFDSLGVAERRHRALPCQVGTERIRLEP